ncbi:uncharacterized protein LOC111114804 isoform X6 [Crassostrea virginica]
MSDDPGPSLTPKLGLTKPAENFCRLCQLIMTVCSDLFRDILSHHIQPANLRRELDNNKNTLLRALKIPDHKTLLFRQSGGQSVSAKDMDLTLLYTLLRNICGIPPHQKGWGKTPNTGDITLAACIERIREQKNAIASHSNIGEIDDIRFQDIWMKLQTDIVNIEKELIGGNMYERAVKVLFSCELTPAKALESADDFNRLYDKMNEVQIETKQYHAQKKARMNTIAKRQSALKRTFIGASASKKARIGRLEKQQSSATLDIKDHLKETESHILHMMQGRLSGIEQHIGGGLSAMKTEIKDRMSAQEEQIEGRMSAMEVKIERRMSSMEVQIESMKSRCYPLDLTSTIEVSGMGYICHISVVSPDKLWVSDIETLKQVDSTGHVLMTLDDEYGYSNDDGGHTVSVEGDFVFIAEVSNSVQSTASDGLRSQYGIHKMTSDGSITTLLTPDLPNLSPRCIHSSHINGDLLIGLTDYSYPRTGRVMRCDGTGRKIRDIELDGEGQGLYGYPQYITENKMNGDIVVSDYRKNALVVVDRSGRHRFDYKGHSTDKSFSPRGVCTDVLGRILVSHTGYDDDSGDICCISLLDRDGRFLTRLLTQPWDDDGFNSLCVDDNNNIYVAFVNKIKVYK